jgi:hypothetical protein
MAILRTAKISREYIARQLQSGCKIVPGHSSSARLIQRLTYESSLDHSPTKQKAQTFVRAFCRR